jgi:hypothetical protein
MTQIDRHIVKLIAKDIEEALKDVAKKYDVEIRYKGGSFTENHATLKIGVTSINESGKPLTNEENDFKIYASFFGLSSSLFGKSFVSNNETYTIVGLKPRSQKYPVLCERSDGKIFKFPAATISLFANAGVIF